MRIVFMGTPDFAVPCLKRLLDDGHDVVGVFSQPDKPQGRKMVLTAPPIKQLALQAKLPVYQPETFKNGAVLPLLQELAPEIIVVVAYGKILPQYVLDLPRYGCVNVHGSLLPRWRGAAPIQWSVIAGDRTAGVTTMQMDAGLDTGDMLLRYETEIGARETAGELYERLATAGAELLSETLRRLEKGDIVPERQDDAASCYASMLDKKLAQVDWRRTAREIDCLVRGLNPWPVALTTLHGERMKLYAAEPVQGSGAPGTVLVSDPKSGLVVACGDGALRLTEIQVVGGKRMQAGDYLRGHAVPSGTVLGES
ncbi:methionyl-tRNA formyltransferase [Intestinibacillus massiliensis]|uniref:methionyl-tRNA formyltransferase n=1 Tax=Intestinibacillus massiliensis TaxID=1871029 RepID=UPI000B35407B|nr:methionyl-tRNA formyltransferase [Intestinibacillus massiliensis]